MADRTSPTACEHDWRLHKSEKVSSYTPAPEGVTAVVNPTYTAHHEDTWYCTKCRLVERTQRVG